MPPETGALLWDVLTAARRIETFLTGRTWDDYASDLLLRSGVERQLEIAGEAMSVLRRKDPVTADRVPAAHKIIGMRNILIHGYAEVNDVTVWRAATEDLEVLIAAVDELLLEFGPPVA